MIRYDLFGRFDKSHLATRASPAVGPTTQRAATGSGRSTTTPRTPCNKLKPKD